MEQSIEGFTSLLEQVEQKDLALEGKKLDEHKALFHLNKWFFENEMPENHSL
jgi:hypothetical protein